MDKIRILIVDDDLAISRLIATNLRARGYDVLTALDGQEAIEIMEKEFVDLMILDIMMPRTDGVEVCRRVREWSKVPIIILSARGDEGDKVKCLELGADDYLTKPFGVAELMARIKTAMRHCDSAKTTPSSPNLHYKDMEINFALHKVAIAGNDVKLTPTEYSVLSYLASNRDRVLTHTMLLQKVWGEEYHTEKEYLRVFIGRLRKKLETDPDHPKYIQTVPGVGYHFAVEN